MVWFGGGRMIIENCNVYKLHDEFINAGIKPFPVFLLENGEGDFTFSENTDMDLVQQIIEAHDPTPLPQQLTENEMIMLAIADLAEIVLGGAE